LTTAWRAFPPLELIAIVMPPGPAPQAYVPLKMPSAGDASAAWAEAAKAMLSRAAFANERTRISLRRI
jgi:hypothetical protein